MFSLEDSESPRLRQVRPQRHQDVITLYQLIVGDQSVIDEVI